MTKFTKNTDLTLFDPDNPWRIIHPKTEGYMQEKGDEEAEALYNNLVRDALARYNYSGHPYGKLSKEDEKRLYKCAKFFVADVKDAFGERIFEICAKKSGSSDADAFERVIDDIGDMDLLFNQVCDNVKRVFSSIDKIYASLFMDAYLHDGQEEVFEMLVALPRALLKDVSNNLLDTWYYSLDVINGKLVVYDHD